MRKLIQFVLGLAIVASLLWYERGVVVPVAGPVIGSAAQAVASRVPALAPVAGAMQRAVEEASKASEAAAPKAAAKPSQGPAVPVKVTIASEQSLPVMVEAVGTVQAIASIPLKPRIDSEIVKVHVEEGAAVKAGDLIFTLDSRAVRAQLAQAEAAIVKDEAQIAQGKLDADRADELYAKRFGTEVTRNTAATNVKTLEAQLEADKANRDYLATQVTFTEIRASVPGRIGSISAKVGWFARQADTPPLATLNQVDPIYVAFGLPQAAFEALRAARAGHEVRVIAKTPKGDIEGRIAFIDNQIDLTTGTVQVKAEFQNADERLWPGAYTPINLVLREDPHAIAVPYDSVQIGQKGPYVFVVKDGAKAELRYVEVERKFGNLNVIRKGLAAGEKVVIDGQLRLSDGTPVTVSSLEPTPAPSIKLPPPPPPATAAAAPAGPAAPADASAKAAADEVDPKAAAKSPGVADDTAPAIARKARPKSPRG